jgi:TP901 family phage tail tape measure protein
MADVANLQVVVGADTSDAEKGLASLGARVESFGGAVATAFGGAAIAGIAAFGAAIGGSVKEAADFEKQISAIGAVSGATSDQLKQISDLALQLGKDTSFSASEAATGIEELTKAGVSMADIMGGAAKASLDLAAAGGVSVAESATIASNAMNVFSKSGADMGHIADVIAGAANASAIDVHQFGYSLQAAGAVAATVGFSFDDLAQAIAVMGQAGITGSDAGTSLKTMMMNLQPSTKAASQMMQQLGIITKDGANQFFDASGKAKSMAQVAQVLQNALKGQTEQQKLATLQTLFGTDAIRAAAVMAKAGAQGFDDMAAAMGKVSAEDVANQRLDNLSGSIEKLKGSVETVAIMVGTAFLPIIRKAVDAATDLVNGWMPAIQVFADQVPGAIDATITTIGDFLSAAAMVVAQFAGIETADATGPWDALTQAISYTVGEMTAALQPALTWLSTIGWPLLQSAMSVVVTYVGGVLVPMFTALWTWLSPNLNAALTWLSVTGMPALLGAMTAVAGWVQTTYIPTLTAVWSWLSDKLGSALTWLANTAWPAMGNAANAVQNWIEETLVPTLKDWYTWLQDRLSPIYTWFITYGWPTLQSAGAAVASWLSGTLFPTLSEWWDWFQARLSPIYSWFITYGWPTLQSAAASVVTWMSSTLFPTLSEWWDWFQARLSPVYTWFITYGWPTMQSAGAAFEGWVTQTLVPTLTTWWDWMWNKNKSAAEWWIGPGTGFPSLVSAATAYNDLLLKNLIPTLQSLQTELDKTDTAQSWVTILQNLSKFGKYLIENVKLGDWFRQVGSGAGEASGQIGYIAEAIAWISRTLAKWSKLLPGTDVPDVGEPPKAPSGSSGGGGGGGGGSSLPPIPEPSTGGGGGGGGGGSSGGGGGGSGTPPIVSPPSGGGGGGGTPTTRDGWAALALQYGAQAGIPAGVFQNQIRQESNFNPDAMSSAGARGIAQFMPATGNAIADQMGVSRADFWASPALQLQGAAFLMHQLSSRYNGDVIAALVGYNAGPQNADYLRPYLGNAQAEISQLETWRDQQPREYVRQILGLAGGGWAGLNGPELAVLGERGPEYVIPNSGLRGGGGHSSMTLNVAIGGRVAEQIVVEGYELAIRRGRLLGAATLPARAG